MEQFFNQLRHNIDNSNGASRIFHGRGKYFPLFDYFNIDFYPPYLILFFYKNPTDEFLKTLNLWLIDYYGARLKGIIFQKRYLKDSPSEIVYGEVPEEHIVQIEKLNYSIKFGKSQNIGFFLDMEKGRKFLRENSAGKKVLNLFSYTCALSVVAMKSGASSVVNFDMSKAAIARGKINHKLNDISLSNVKFYDHDIFKSFARLKKEGPYDLVIIDPPSDHGDHFKIERDYPKLIRRISDWISPKGIVLTCLNSPHFNFADLKNIVELNTLELEYCEEFGFPDHFLETNADSGLKIIVWKKYES